MHDIEFEDVTKEFDNGVVALDHLTLTVRAREMFGLVGPSGCGKTTAVRVLAGLEDATAGRVRIGGTDVGGVETRSRDLGLVTQGSQLLSHRTARRNISFPLDLRRRDPQEEIDERVVMEAAGLGIEHLLDRSPRTLSEGERRRVQLARAVIRAPATLLMDEPLAALDDQIRVRMRTDVIRLQRLRGITSILVTSRQEDAMAMCDRIAVLFDGVLHQVGTPSEVYHRPATSRVASFFGEPAMNIVEAVVERDAVGPRVRVLGSDLRLWGSDFPEYEGRPVLVGVRAEDLEIGKPSDRSVEAAVVSTEPMGHQTVAVVRDPQGHRINCVLAGPPPPAGTVLDVGVRADRMHVFDPHTEMAISHPSSV
ncbi:MAG: ABC transporter ATP-binding protein [Actinomycetota bacterium]